jgi:hypothetical protein
MQLRDEHRVLGFVSLKTVKVIKEETRESLCLRLCFSPNGQEIMERPLGFVPLEANKLFKVQMD